MNKPCINTSFVIIESGVKGNIALGVDALDENITGYTWVDDEHICIHTGKTDVLLSGIPVEVWWRMKQNERVLLVYFAETGPVYEVTIHRDGRVSL